MKAVKILLILAITYVGIVVVFESLIGYLQPQSDNTLVLVTNDENGSHERVLTQIDYNEQVYVAVNHWPRAWYHRAKANPDVSATIAGETGDYTAILVEDQAEYDSLQAARPQPLLFKFLIGFAPREFMRLEPVLSE